jgi:hypothetical protein
VAIGADRIVGLDRHTSDHFNEKGTGRRDHATPICIASEACLIKEGKCEINV